MTNTQPIAAARAVSPTATARHAARVRNALCRRVADTQAVAATLNSPPTAATRRVARVGVLILVSLCLGACAIGTAPLTAPPTEKQTTARLPNTATPPPRKMCWGTAYAYYIDGRREWLRKIRTQSPDIEQYGIASWYGRPFHGRRTANGERYDMYANTAAHKSLPMDSLVEVTNLHNGKRTIVRINDRGPFIDGRIIDLSFGAAGEIGMLQPGIVPVRILVIYQGSRKSRYKRDDAL